MRTQPVKHEDDRRVLTEYISDMPFRRAKVIKIKKKCVLGQHYHKKSDSVFYILQGKGSYKLQPVGTKKITHDWLFEGECLFVPKDVIHTFELYEGTIMLEAASEPYDKEDEIQVFE